MFLNVLIKGKNVLTYYSVLLYLAKCIILHCRWTAFIVANVSVANTQYVFQHDLANLHCHGRKRFKFVHCSQY